MARARKRPALYAGLLFGQAPCAGLPGLPAYAVPLGLPAYAVPLDLPPCAALLGLPPNAALLGFPPHIRLFRLHLPVSPPGLPVPPPITHQPNRTSNWSTRRASPSDGTVRRTYRPAVLLGIAHRRNPMRAAARPPSHRSENQAIPEGSAKSYSSAGRAYPDTPC
ncbi:hypothetical protein D3C81_936760 [compost metagenome]